MFVVIEVLVVVALLHSIAESIIVKTTNANENTTTPTPFRLRLRWPGKNFRTSTVPPTVLSSSTHATKFKFQVQKENVTTAATTTTERENHREQFTMSTELVLDTTEYNAATEEHAISWNHSTVPSIFSDSFFKIFSTETENKFSIPKQVEVTMAPPSLHRTKQTETMENSRENQSHYPTYVVSATNHRPITEENLFIPSKPKSKDNTSSSTKEVQVSSGGTYVYVVGIVGIIPTVGVFVWCVRHVLTRPQKSKEVSPVTHTTYSTVDVPTNESNDDVTAIVSTSDHIQDKYEHTSIEANWKRISLEYPRHNLDLLEILGEGNFGVVWKAEAINIIENRHTTIVAVKTVKENASYKERQELLRELSVMQRFDHHPNVVKLLGCCTESEPYFLIMEFVKNGKLQSFLRDHRSKRKYYNSNGTSHNLTSRDLTMFAYQVALGMEYISSVRVIHRDLAARNILVDHNNVCKVADFGLSRCFEDGDCNMYEQKTKGALPIRWMAPESLYLSVFTTKSDVWAFGILLWEIVTLGSTPYPGMSAREVIHHVQKGNTMECPNHCHPELYSVMCACWVANPNCRPTFSVLCQRLENLLQVQAGYVDLEHFPENRYYNLYQSPGEKV